MKIYVIDVHARAARKLIQAMPFEDAIDHGVGDFDVVIPSQIPDDPDRPQMIGPPQM